jgi:hypothetical protein
VHKKSTKKKKKKNTWENWKVWTSSKVVQLLKCAHKKSTTKTLFGRIGDFKPKT